MRLSWPGFRGARAARWQWGDALSGPDTATCGEPTSPLALAVGASPACYNPGDLSAERRGDRLLSVAADPSEAKPNPATASGDRQRRSTANDKADTQREIQHRFFLFGMGQRTKFIYRNGRLLDAHSGAVIRQWNIKRDTIIPPDYCVVLETDDGERVAIVEDENAVWIEESGRRVAMEGT